METWMQELTDGASNTPKVLYRRSLEEGVRPRMVIETICNGVCGTRFFELEGELVKEFPQQQRT
jgi:hypothetical protein